MFWRWIFFWFTVLWLAFSLIGGVVFLILGLLHSSALWNWFLLSLLCFLAGVGGVGLFLFRKSKYPISGVDYR